VTLLFFALISGAVAIACSSTSEPTPIGGLGDGGGTDAVEEESAPPAPPPSCKSQGGKCLSITTKSCPVQITGIGLCEDTLICCASDLDDGG